ncbi:MAG: zf-HC2 domain-containing protein [Bacteroidota bacterium]
MDCREARDYVSAVIDGEVGAEKRKEFDGHVTICPSCRNELETEGMIKRLIGGKLSAVKAPDDLRISILQQVHAGFPTQNDERTGVETFLGKVFSRSFLKPVLALGVVVVIALVGISLFGRRGSEPISPASATADMVDQAVEHYSDYLQGGVKLQLVSSNHAEIRNFFKDKVAYDVYVPDVEHAELVGGVLCEHGGVKFLNLVYMMGDKVVYFYTGCSKEMKASGKVGLCAKAESDLQQTGWYFDTTRANCNVAVWREGDRVCSAVADMKQGQLLALLKEEK